MTYLTDLFNPTFLIFLGILILVVAILIVYFESKMREQNHKIQTMFSIVSTLAEEMNSIKQGFVAFDGLPNPRDESRKAMSTNQQTQGGSMSFQQPSHTLEKFDMLEKPDNLNLIEVSDDSEEDNSDDEEDEDDVSEEEEEDDDDAEDVCEINNINNFRFNNNSEQSETDSEVEDLENTHTIKIGEPSETKILIFSQQKMNLDDDKTAYNPDFDELDQLDEESFNDESVNDDELLDDQFLEEESPDNFDSKSLSDFPLQNEKVDVLTEAIIPDEELQFNEAPLAMELKKINISDLEEVQGVSDVSSSDYKKYSLNKLRSIVSEKGLVKDSSKLKKNELLKLLGVE
jgi:hypothetical protein